jgi:hypothetical protein
MSKSTDTKVKLTGEALRQIRLEAELTNVPMSKILRDYTVEYIKLKNESIQASNGKVEEGSLIHTYLGNLETRIANGFDNIIIREDSIKADIKIIANLVDTLVKLYLNHTPEIAKELKEERVRSALVRYDKYINAVKKSITDETYNILTEIKDLILKDIENS